MQSCALHVQCVYIHVHVHVFRGVCKATYANVSNIINIIMLLIHVNVGVHTCILLYMYCIYIYTCT